MGRKRNIRTELVSKIPTVYEPDGKSSHRDVKYGAHLQDHAY